MLVPLAGIAAAIHRGLFARFATALPVFAAAVFLAFLHASFHVLAAAALVITMAHPKKTHPSAKQVSLARYIFPQPPSLRIRPVSYRDVTRLEWGRPNSQQSFMFRQLASGLTKVRKSMHRRLAA